MARRPPKPEGKPSHIRRKEHRQRNRKGETLRTLSKGLPDQEDYEIISRDITNSSDRSAAIIISSLLERSLEEAIRYKLKRYDDGTMEKLHGRDGPLSGFYAKIHLGYALGLYDKRIMHELECVRKIRNTFAHTARPITLNTQLIIDECKNLDDPENIRSITNNKDEIPKERSIFINRCISIIKLFLSKAVLSLASKMNIAGQSVPLKKRYHKRV